MKNTTYLKLKTHLLHRQGDNDSATLICPRPTYRSMLRKSLYLTINKQKGPYNFKRLVFDIASAPAIWQWAMDYDLQDILRTQCYLDEIIVPGGHEEEYLETLKRVLKCLEEYRLRANCIKC